MTKAVHHTVFPGERVFVTGEKEAVSKPSAALFCQAGEKSSREQPQESAEWGGYIVANPGIQENVYRQPTDNLKYGKNKGSVPIKLPGGMIAPAKKEGSGQWETDLNH